MKVILNTEDMSWINLAQDRVQWRDVGITVMSIQVL
jgi:hypothetical protein